MYLGPAEFFIIAAVAVPIFVIVGALWLVSSRRRVQRTPRQVLDDRVAQGEIRSSEYDDLASRLH